MAFVTGLLLIDAPASALNNLGNIPGERTDNVVGVKMIRAKDGAYPYVSAQAFRYWLRTTLDNAGVGWKSAPVYPEEKIAYTDANPIEWWDDDLFGYMRAPSQKESAKAKRAADESRTNETPTTGTITRVAPFRVSTLVSIAPVSITKDFGVMARHEGFPVPHEHQFYRTTLKGMFSLNLRTSGSFSYSQKTGFRNLDDERIKRAEEKKLKHDEKGKTYRLSTSERIKRISALFEGMSQLEGGAKQTLHYTDVAPSLVILAVTKGGNHIFGHVIGANGKGLPEIKQMALEEALTVFKDEILSTVYVGWVKGYLDDERTEFEKFAKGKNIQISHPREAYQALIEAFKKNEAWLD
jgi:CRISPR-associated protein Cst2